MIRLIEALNFRCLRHVHRPLENFHILAGPNASGKTTFLDVITFLGRLVSDGLEAAVTDRTRNFEDLVWNRQGTNFEMTVEAEIPQKHKAKLHKNFDTIRYEVSIGVDANSDEVSIQKEKLWLKPWEDAPSAPTELFPREMIAPTTIMTAKAKPRWQCVVTKAPGGNDNFYVEVRGPNAGKGWFPSIRLGPRKSALGNLPEDESKFPCATWLKQMLKEGIQNLVLNSLVIRKASPPGQGRGFKPDGSNLPWVIADLKKEANQKFMDWIRHVQMALPDIVNIETEERKDDRHRYLKILYRGGLEVPSWAASDGTLRLLALTLPAYLPSLKGVYLIEEPENGIHPRAAETVFQSLSSVYDAQILMATHSPVILSQAKAEQVLCFKKTESGATDIVLGSEHPQLRDWQGQPNLGVLFASGVLG